MENGIGNSSREPINAHTFMLSHSSFVLEWVGWTVFHILSPYLRQTERYTNNLLMMGM